MNGKIEFIQITCPNTAKNYFLPNRRRKLMKRYELTDGLTVCPACGQLKGHYIYAVNEYGQELIEEVKEENA